MRYRVAAPIAAVATALILSAGSMLAFHAVAEPQPRALPQPAAVDLSQTLDREQAADRSSRSYLRTPFPTPKPKPPKPSPTPKATQAPAPPPPVYTPAPANATLACIRGYESHGNYRIVSSTGYQGAYQLSPRYTDDWARRYGYGKWASTPAHLWPPAVQDAVALALGLDTHWRMWSDFTAYHCPGFRS